MLQFSLYFGVVIKRCMRFQQKKKNCTKDKNEPHEHIMFIHVFSRRSEQRKIILSVITIIVQIIKKHKMQRTREP